MCQYLSALLTVILALSSPNQGSDSQLRSWEIEHLASSPLRSCVYQQEPNSWSLGRPHDVNFSPTELNSTQEDVHIMESVDVKLNSEIATLSKDVCDYSSPYPPAAPPLNLPMKEFCACPRLCYTYTWDTGIPGLIPVATTYSAWASLPIVDKYMYAVARFRGKPRISIRFTGSSSYQGRLRVSFAPRRVIDTHEISNASVATLDNYTGTQQTRLAALPNAVLDVTIPKECTVLLPYIMKEDYAYSAVTTLDDWYMFVCPIESLVSVYGVTVTPIKVEFWIAYDDVEVISYSSQGLDEPGGVISRALHYASQFASHYSSPISMALSLGSTLSSKLGYSRDPNPVATQMISRSAATWSTADGEMANTYSLALDYRAQRNQNPNLLPCGMNDFKEFSRRTNFVSLSTPTNPISMAPDAIPLDGSNYLPHPLNIVTLLHERWTGSMRVKLMFVGSPLVRTRIGINIISAGTTLPTSFISNGSALAKQIDICGSTEVVMDVPWFPSPTSVATGIYTTTDTSSRAYLVWFVLAGPFGPTATPPVPYCEVYLEPGDDFDYCSPTNVWINRFQQSQGRLQDMVGEGSTSFKQLAQRRTFVCNLTNGSNSADGLKGITFPRTGLPIIAGSVSTFGPSFYQYVVNNHQWSFHRFFASISYGFYGGNVWSVVYRGANGTMTSFPLSFGTTLARPGSLLQTSLGTTTWSDRGSGFQTVFDRHVEMTIPDKKGERFIATGITPLASTSTPVASFVVATYPELEDSYSIDMIHAASSDVQYGMFMPPVFTLRA